MKDKDRDMLKKLLVSVFQVPPPKGVLFEKVAHHLVTNGVLEEFRFYAYYNERVLTPRDLSSSSLAISHSKLQPVDYLRTGGA